MDNFSQQFKDEIYSGMISCKKHPGEDIWILNYTQECQFSSNWNNATLQSRGLIINEAGEIVSRPFKKFFNLSEHTNPNFPPVPYGESFKAYEKLDGSLGISYYVSGKWRIATRGSFTSEQAIFASELLNSKYTESLGKMDASLTYLFEIIYPENRIVCDYGDAKELVLLAVIRTLDGLEIPLEKFTDLQFRQPKLFSVNSINDLPRDTSNFEGYVIRFESGMRVKVKLDEYVRLHKIMTGFTPNRIWEILSNGGDLKSIIRDVPDEFFEELVSVADDLISDHSSLFMLYRYTLSMLDLSGKSRKEQAILIKSICERSQKQLINDSDLIIPLNDSVLFLLLDGKIDKAKEKIWQLIKPIDGNKIICKTPA